MQASPLQLPSGGLCCPFLTGHDQSPCRNVSLASTLQYGMLFFFHVLKYLLIAGLMTVLDTADHTTVYGLVDGPDATLPFGWSCAIARGGGWPGSLGLSH